MKNVICGIGIIFYVLGFLFLLDFLYNFQNLTFKNSYFTILYPIFALFLLGFYVSLFKLFKKITEPNVKVKIRNRNKMLSILIGIVAILLLSIKFSFNPYHISTLLAFFGYVISLALGFQLIKIVRM